MAKHTHETYEFLPTSADDADQFFVVEESGTFIINRSSEFAQGQDVKETLEEVIPDTVCNDEISHFYVNANNSQELVSVSDQFIIPHRDNNTYTNEYFLQSVAEEKLEEVEENIVECKELSAPQADVESEEISDSMPKNNFTEITLSDEQYQILEDKGWILLEINDKIFLLNSLGLHDITSDEKLIHKLKTEFMADNNEEQLSLINSTKENLLEDASENLNKQDMSDLEVLEEDGMQVEENTQDEKPFLTSESSALQISPVSGSDSNTLILQPVLARNKNDILLNNNIKDSIKRDTSTIRIKTKYLFKDIPPEIVLGKTINGKQLVARVVKTEKPMMDPNKETDNTKLVNEDNANQQTPNTGLSEAVFEKLIQQRLSSGKDKCSIKTINAAETVVHQLLRVPAFKPAVIERYLIITKAIFLEDVMGNTCKESMPSLVMGRVIHEHGGWQFVYLPDLLQTLMQHREKKVLNNIPKVTDEGSFLHIHIRETKGMDGIVRISITLNKRHLPASLTRASAIRQPNTVFACSACAAVYPTEQGLRVHQEAECKDIDDKLTIVTENTDITKAFSVINSGKVRQYVCNQCNAVFPKLSNCQKHIGTHFNSTAEDDIEEDGEEGSCNKSGRVFKCKMCPSTYLYAATLSKHIVSQHIKIKGQVFKKT